MSPVVLGQPYRHFKGGRYIVLHLAKDADLGPQHEVVVYLSLDHGVVWTRPRAQWSVLVLWPDGQLRARFTLESDLPSPKGAP